VSLRSSIEWTESTWNPVTGCTKISLGCKNCYAERISKRLQAMDVANYKDGFEVRPQNHVLEYPLKWKKPRMIFVNSMSDLFHENVSVEYIQKVFDVMNLASWHYFQILTKRSFRLAKLNTLLKWSPHIWMGVSVENQDHQFRIDDLRRTNACIKFISFEPLLGPISEINLIDVDWVIVGGESGPQARSMKKEWVLKIRDQCQKSEIPFFFKQWGGFNKKKNGRKLEGKTWNELPIRTNEFHQTIQ